MIARYIGAVNFALVIVATAHGAPTLEVTNGGLDSNGNWIWNVSVIPDPALFTNPDDDPDEGLGGTIEVELDLRVSLTPLINVTRNETNFPDDIAGISAQFPSPASGINVEGNNIFAAVGSRFFTSADPQQILTVITDGPSQSRPTTQLSWFGGQDRIRQGGQSFETVATTASLRATWGDSDLKGTVFLADLNAVLNNFGLNGATWSDGDFDGDGMVFLSDLKGPLNNFGAPSGQIQYLPGLPTTGAGASVPEPSTMALCGLAMVGLVGLVRRRD